MDDDAFDHALIGAAFEQAAALGWRQVSVAGAARAAGLPLPRARARFPARSALLLRFGRIADQAALAEMSSEGSVRDRLFDLLMRRIDVLQAHRPGVVAVLHALPGDPPSAALLACATRRSLRWLGQAAGMDFAGLRGALLLRGLLAVWLWTLRAWERDTSADLGATMAALDTALNRAEQAARWLCGRAAPPADPSHGPPPDATLDPVPPPAAAADPAAVAADRPPASSSDAPPAASPIAAERPPAPPDAPLPA